MITNNRLVYIYSYNDYVHMTGSTNEMSIYVYIHMDILIHIPTHVYNIIYILHISYTHAYVYMHIIMIIHISD